jgi:sec-independent protein translocase protein TatA
MHFSPLQLILILIIVVLLFGTKKLRNMGGDLGEAFKNFKKAVKDGDEDQAAPPPPPQVTQTPANDGRVIEGEAKVKDKV